MCVSDEQGELARLHVEGIKKFYESLPLLPPFYYRNLAARAYNITEKEVLSVS